MSGRRATGTPQRRNWSFEATEALLKAVSKSAQLPLLMGSTSAPNEAAWRAVRDEMGPFAKGRTVQHLRGKWKLLKAQFHAQLSRKGSPGRLAALTPAWQSRIRALWDAAGRPPFRDRHYTGAINKVSVGESTATPRPPPRAPLRRSRWPLNPREEEDQPSPSGSASPASVDEVVGGEEEPLQPPSSPEAALEGAPPAASPVQVVIKVEDDEEDLLQPTTFSAEPAQEGELWNSATGVRLPPTPVQEPWPPSEAESRDAVGQPEPEDHQECHQEIQRLGGELERARLLIHLQGQQLAREQDKVRSLGQIIAQQRGIMAKQEAIIQEQHAFQEKQQQQLNELLLQPSQ